MTKIKTFSLRIVPVIGIGAYLDRYTKHTHGMDGWQYTVILPFLRVRFGAVYLNIDKLP